LSTDCIGKEGVGGGGEGFQFMTEKKVDGKKKKSLRGGVEAGLRGEKGKL